MVCLWACRLRSVVFLQWRSGVLLSVEMLGVVAAALVVFLMECAALVASFAIIDLLLCVLVSRAM